MRAILIDPHTRAVQEVDYSGQFEGPKGAYGLIGCSTVEAVPLRGTTDTLYVDEEGLFKPPQPGFYCVWFPQLLVGRGLLVGPPDEDGHETPTTEPLSVIRAAVGWLGPRVPEGEWK